MATVTEKKSPSPRDWRSIIRVHLSFFRGGFSGSGKIADVFGRQKKIPQPKGLEEYHQGASTGKLLRGGFSGSGKRETM